MVAAVSVTACRKSSRRLAVRPRRARPTSPSRALSERGGKGGTGEDGHQRTVTGVSFRSIGRAGRWLKPERCGVDGPQCPGRHRRQRRGAYRWWRAHPRDLRSAPWFPDRARRVAAPAWSLERLCMEVAEADRLVLLGDTIEMLEGRPRAHSPMPSRSSARSARRSAPEATCSSSRATTITRSCGRGCRRRSGRAGTCRAPHACR